MGVCDFLSLSVLGLKLGVSVKIGSEIPLTVCVVCVYQNVNSNEPVGFPLFPLGKTKWRLCT